MPRNLYSALGVSQKFDLAHKFVTSPVIRTPCTFAAIRLAVATYTLFTLLFTLIWQTVKQNHGNRCVPLPLPLGNPSPNSFSYSSFFSYFTNLTYTGLCAYYCAASTQTIAYSLKWRKSGAGVGYPLQRWPKILQALHIILQSSVTTFREPFSLVSLFWFNKLTPRVNSNSCHNRFLELACKLGHIFNSILEYVFGFDTAFSSVFF